MNIVRNYVTIICLLSVLTIAPTFSYAVTVTNTNDMGAGSLRQAVIDTPGGGTVDFQAGLSGTITLMSGQITIDKNLTITGPGADMITVSGNNSSRIFNITDGTATVVVVDISGLTLANGQVTGVGGAIFDGENLTLSDSVLVNNNCTTNGGAIFVDVSAVLTLTRDTFTGNTAGQEGGAIGLNTNALVNSITDCEFTGNGAELSGGAIHNALGFITAISGTTFKSNTAINLANTADGGAISITGNSNQGRIDSIVNSTFYGNIASGNGGAIYTLPNGSNNGVIFLSFVTIAGNQAADGGGIYIDDIGNSINKDIRNSILSNNSPDNCAGDSLLTNEGGNYSDDFSCGFGFGTGDDADIALGPIQDNGGNTETMELMDSDPKDNALDCNASRYSAANFGVGDDQRDFPRPFGSQCDSGAYEAGVKIRITKLTEPPFSPGPFNFTSTGFSGLINCGIDDMFSLNHGESLECEAVLGSYSIAETVPAGQVVNIACPTLPASNTIDNTTGEIDFTIASADESLDCYFVNFEPDSLFIITVLAEGDTDCPTGGIKIETGEDTNQNGVLDMDEITNTSFVCNGEQGPPGEPGPPGLSSVLDVSPEPAGPNCAFGGLKIENGLDANMNEMLDPDEITTTSYVCNGLPGDSTLFDSTPEPSGANCQFGGFKITSGVDENKDTILNPGEVDNTFYLCNGTPGAQGPGGTGSLINVDPIGPGENCQFGGIKVETGKDGNKNGKLDSTEVEDTSYVCNGEQGGSGDSPLVDVVPVPKGDECPKGGVRINTGNDTNGNGVLDESEITDSEVVCNGSDGSGGCAIAGPGATDTSLPAFLLIPAFILFARLRRRRS